MGYHKLSLSLALLLAATTTLFADVVVKYSVHADLIAPPARLSEPGACDTKVELPQTGDVLTLTWCADKARLDRPGLSVILRADEGRLYFVFHRVRKFAWIKYPVRYNRYRLPFEEAAGTENLRYHLRSIVGPEQTRFLDREAARYAAVAVNALGNEWRSMFVLSSQLSFDPGLASALRAVLHDLRFGGNGWLDLLPTQGHLPLVWEEAKREPETESLYREEATDIKERPVPPDTYALPQEYAKIEYDVLCMRER